MSTSPLNHLTPANRDLLTTRQKHLQDRLVTPEKFWPYWKPCNVRVLLVVDGLDFSDDDFGLSTFIRTLLDMPGGYVRFRITLAHIGQVGAAAMMAGEPRIENRITQFKFDDPAHFTSTKYDQVWLFGIAQTFAGRGTASNNQPYPTDRLADPELRAITEFMNGGGGLFATGDHGSLGKALGHAVPRARSMRLWDSTSAQMELDEVSMKGQRRNDTNRLGSSAGSQFEDQSDDTPQIVQPKIYQRTAGIFRYSFPHPLLCGPKGMIRVMPDHPHEGECIEPAPNQTNAQLDFGGPLGPEYPNATDGGARPLPEVISVSTVLSGTTSGGKDPTLTQCFGGISAYDGHRASIGRVVTDATWHHFVNINLVGDSTMPNLDPKSLGFLFSASGQEHLEQIRVYYRNLAVWLARPNLIVCMNTRIMWQLLWSARTMEAVLATTDLRLADVQPHIFWIIGKHARDVLGRYASQCQSLKLIIDLMLKPNLPLPLLLQLDPWMPDTPRRTQLEAVAWFDGEPLVNIALGAALVALREHMPHPDERQVAELDTDRVAAILAEGARVGVERGLASATSAMTATRTLLRPTQRP